MNYQGSPDLQMSNGLFRGAIMMLFALLFMASANTTFAQSPEIRKAFRYYDIEQPSKMIPALEQAVKAAPGNTYYLGLGYILKGDLEKALSTFEKGISADDKDPLVVAGKGHVKLLQKKTTEGKALLTEAAEMNRKKTAAQWTAIGRAYLSDTKFLLDAISALEKAKALENGSPEVHMLLGDAYLLQNRGGESVSSYERAASADPKWAKPLFNVAKVYQRSKNNDIVMDYLNRAVTVDPEFAPAHKELAETYYLQKKPDQAVKAIEKYLGISENTGDAKFQYAFFLFMAKNYEKANSIFKEVLNDKNASATALKFYAFSLIEQKKYDEAKNVLQQFFQKAKPEEIKASDYAQYGKLLLELKEDSLANEAFARGIELDSTDVDVLELQADTYFKNKKYAEAAKAFEKKIAATEKPLANDLWRLGNAYFFSEQYLEADSAFTQLSKRVPTQTFGYLWAAKSRAQYDSAGEQGVAVPMYEAYLEKALANPENKEKEKKNIIEAYDYLGQYALYHKKDIPQATSYFQKILQLDPNNTRANEFLDAVKEMNTTQQPRGGKGRK
ncbi:MAG TPA: tetratricopeptide repeat protein [Chryseosolibacter sp.]|nr:tetratricopeptide repeat protein [Chryseosolibacter sp.]